VYYGERIWTQTEGQTERVVVVPLGSLEQHGHHLPMLTDSMIGAEIVRRAETELGEAALFTPMLWIGASDHHLGFEGTLSLNNDLYVAVLVDILESLIGAGYRRILLLNAHGGNIMPGRMAMYDVQLRHLDKPDLWISLATWFTIAAEQIAAIEELDQKAVTHACELETSMILRLRPELVDLNAARGTTIPFESAFYVPDFGAPSRVDVARSFNQLSVTGAFGHPEKATAAKGELLFTTAVREVVAFVREFAAWNEFEPQ
jgi:creatinine amidohydrolase